jgi:hypothetical protein
MCAHSCANWPPLTRAGAAVCAGARQTYVYHVHTLIQVNPLTEQTISFIGEGHNQQMEEHGMFSLYIVAECVNEYRVEMFAAIARNQCMPVVIHNSKQSHFSV